MRAGARSPGVKRRGQLLLNERAALCYEREGDERVTRGATRRKAASARRGGCAGATARGAAFDGASAKRIWASIYGDGYAAGHGYSMGVWRCLRAAGSTGRDSASGGAIAGKNSTEGGMQCVHCAMYVDATRGESYTCARPTGQRGLRTPAFGADTVTRRKEPVRHVVRGPSGSLGPRPARPAVNIHSAHSEP